MDGATSGFEICVFPDSGIRITLLTMRDCNCLRLDSPIAAEGVPNSKPHTRDESEWIEISQADIELIKALGIN